MVKGKYLKTEITKTKLRLSLKRYFEEHPEARQNISDKLKESWQNKSSECKQSIGEIGAKWLKEHPEHLQKIHKNMLGDNNPSKRVEVRQKISHRLKEVMPLIAEKKSEIMKTLWKNPDFRDKTLMSMRKAFKQSSFRKARSVCITKRNIANDPLIRDKMTASLKRRWAEDEFKDKMLKILRNTIITHPNNKEVSLAKYLNQAYPGEWEYVGDGRILIGHKNPDFINKQKNLIIELFGDYWHTYPKVKDDREMHMQKRINHFAKYGYKTLIVWQSEISTAESFINKVQDFVVLSGYDI